MPEQPWPLTVLAQLRPQLIALTGPERTLNYGELCGIVEGVAQHLQEWELPRAARVAIAMTQSELAPVMLLACIRAGLIAFPMNPRLPHTALKGMALRAQCALAITDGDGSVVPEAPHLDPRKLADMLPCPAPEDLTMRTDQLATVVATAGSTGEPKLAVHSYGNHFRNAIASNRNIHVAPRDRWLLSLPLYHVSGIGIVFRCMLGGATMVVPPPDEPLHESIRRHGITHVSLVPTQLYRLLRDAPESLRGLRAILLGGGPAAQSLVRDACRHGLPLYRSYGLTETASQCTTTCPGDGYEALCSSGRPLYPGDVAVTGDGEIRARGRTLFQGYLDGDSIALPLDEEGWFRTGDRGMVDDWGRLHVLGRVDNMFVCGGENLYPEEIEAALCALEDVEEAIVVPVADPEYGQRPVAFVRARTPLDQDALRQRLRESLPGYKMPGALLPLPENEDGQLKRNRKELAAIAAKAIREGL